MATIFAGSLPLDNILTKAPTSEELLFYWLLAFKELGRRNESVPLSVADDAVNKSKALDTIT